MNRSHAGFAVILASFLTASQALAAEARPEASVYLARARLVILCSPTKA
jgi:hypothetical protein